MLLGDPLELARRQLERDRARCAAFPHLLDRKLARMRASPLAYLRGAAPLFYEVLAEHREVLRGAKGRGWIAGDLHLENFGAYRPALHEHAHGKARGDEPIAAFDLNDFDEAVVGPWAIDVLRLVTSMLLGGRELGASGPRALDLATALVREYAAGGRRMPALPPPVEHLVARVATRTRKQLLDARTEVVRGARRFARGARYEPLSKKLEGEAARAFARYAARVAESDGIDQASLEPIDLAFRVAGTGSLGGLRVAVLARGKGGADGAWIFDMKAEGAPSASPLVGAPGEKPAKRVVAAMSACLQHPPRMLGWTKMTGLSMLVRRLAPQEDKLDLAALRDEHLEPLARYLGALTARAHRRGARALGKKDAPRWSEEVRARLVDAAIAMAGLHEGAYLAMCRMTR